MSNISDQLLQAIEIVADEKISKLRYDKTVQAKVYSIINIDIGEYKVRYNGNIFTAYASDISKKYKIDEAVYVNIPEGDFSNKKLILSRVADSSLSQNQLAALRNSIVEISPSIETFYDLIFDQPVGVVAGAPPEDPKSQVYVLPDIQEKDNSLFFQYANNYENIRIKASFMTQFHEMHLRGNYGIEVEFYTSDGGVVPYRLDFQNFNGDPYSFSVYAEQQVVIKVQKSYLLGLKSIKLFQEDFAYDRTSKYVLDEANQVFVEYIENVEQPNIFVNDISIQYVEVKDLSNSAYHLFISPLKGLAFTEGVISLSFLGRLVHEGQDIMDGADSCQWFVRDLAVMVGHQDYNKDVGVGWKALPDEESNRLDVGIDEVVKQEKYKLLVIYNDIAVTAEIEVFNLTNPIEYALEQVVENNQEVLLRITNEVLVGDWYVMYPDGAYKAVEGGQKSRDINITPFLQYESTTFYVTVYKDDQRLGTLEHSILSSQSQEDVAVTYNGQDIFQYDANGDIAIEDSEKERTLEALITWREGRITGYRVVWTTRDGTIIPDNKEGAITPSASMLDGLWVDNYSVLHYNLRQKYRLDYTNNTIYIRIETYAGDVYTFEKEILFLKDGDQGTNGTTYVAAIRPCEEDLYGKGAKLSGFQALRYNKGWIDDLNLRCYIYRDGELINSDPRYEIGYTWTGDGVAINLNTLSREQVNIYGLAGVSPQTSALYVKVQIDIKAEDGKKTTIYASYPIDTLVGLMEMDEIDMMDIPSYVKYTASGVSPSYYQKELLFCADGQVSSDVESLVQDLLLVEEREKNDGSIGRYIKPTDSFIYENVMSDDNSNIAVLQLNIPNSSDKIIHPIIMYLDTYGNEAINGWDGTALELGEDGQYLLAPQVGAGEKDEANRFTGVVMGKDTLQEKVGLYGYQAGVNTFGLKQDGTAFFGAKSGGGQIIIDGRHATIFGGDVELSSSGRVQPAANGMYITLADKSYGEDVDNQASSDTVAIGIGYDEERREENFRVTYDGKLTATGADVHGEIYATSGHIGGNGRSSSGWSIEENRLFSGSGSNHVELNSNREEVCAMWAGASESNSAIASKFAVTKDGKLYAKEGNIGGWVLKTSYLQSSNGRVGMAPSSNAAFWAGAGLSQESTSIGSTSEARFLVTQSGQLYCSNADVRGAITANSGEIGGWSINSGIISAGGISLNSSGSISAGNGFSISGGGHLTCNSANISGTINAGNGGSIGGWKIVNGALVSSDGKIGLYPGNDNKLIATDYGNIGMIVGSSTPNDPTINFGIDTRGAVGDQSIILQSGNNVRLSGKRIYLDALEEITILSAPQFFISDDMFGSSLPSSGSQGQIFFLIE